MTKEQRYFITLLSDYIHGRQSKAPAYHVNWNQIASIASEQVLSGIIYQQCRKMKKISTGAKRELKEGYFSDVYQSVNSDYAYRQVVEALGKNEITCRSRGHCSGTIIRLRSCGPWGTAISL